ATSIRGVASSAMQRPLSSARLAVDVLGVESLFGILEFELRRDAGLPQRHGPVETGAPPGVAGARALLLDLDPDRVLVAIDPQLGDLLRVTRCLALLPKRPPRPREIPGLAGFAGALERLGVHVRDHQHV